MTASLMTCDVDDAFLPALYYYVGETGTVLSRLCIYMYVCIRTHVC